MTYTLYAWLHRQVGEGDGIAPIGSQRRGEELFTATARFDRAQFEAMWTSVARFVAAAAHAMSPMSARAFILAPTSAS